MEREPATPVREYTVEELLAWRALTPDQKLTWLAETLRLLRDFVPPEKQRAWMRARSG